MPRREVTPHAVTDDPRAVLFVTDVAHLQPGAVRHAPGTLGPLLEYGVITSLIVTEAGILIRLDEAHAWIDLGPRIRDAVRGAVDLDGWRFEHG